MKKTATENDLIEIGGTRWTCLAWAGITIERHGFIGQRMQEGGLTQLKQKPGEKLAEFFCRFVFQAMISGEAYELLAAFLVPAGLAEKDWTPDQARQTAQRLKELYQAGHQEEIQKQLAQIGAGFLASQLLSTGSSRTALESDQEGAPAEKPAVPDPAAPASPSWR